MSVPSFSHLEPGTDEATWTDAWHDREVSSGRGVWRPLDADSLFARVDRAIVVSAHPDDETLGAGGLLAEAARRGLPATVVALTGGEGSHPDSPTRSREDLQRIRRRELMRATAVLHDTAEVRHEHLPDGKVADHLDEATAAIVAAIRRGDNTLIVAPWRGDGHPDHEAAGRAASAAALRTDARLLEYPVWFWHWGTPADMPWGDTVRLELGGPARERKLRALAAHASQIAPLSPAGGDEAVLGPAMVARASRAHETFFELPRVDDVFERLHRDRRDPWRVESSAYEAAKRAATLDAMPRRRYRLAIDAGCSIGRLTVELAPRADRVIAIDGSATAVASARERTSALGGVAVLQAEIPEGWCAAIESVVGGDVATADLVVVSEVGYFLSPCRLDALLGRACATLEAGGDLVLCHWRHPISGWPLDAAAVHAAADAHPRLIRIRQIDAPDYLLDVYRRGDA